MTVSAILTFFNNREYVDSALAMVRAQTFRDFELIIVDDGSSDGTREALVEQLAGATDVRLVLNDENLGVAASRNAAVRSASGEFVWFIDCDDKWSPRILEVLVREAHEYSADMVICGAARVTSFDEVEGKRLDGITSTLAEGRSAVQMILLGGIRGYLWNKLIRRELLLAHPFPIQSSQSDFAAVSAIIFAGARVRVIDEILYWHVERLGSITNSKLKSFDNMSRAMDAVERGVRGGDYTGLERELQYFRQWFYRSSIVNTSIRLGVSDEELGREVRRLRREPDLNDLRVVAAFSRREAIIATLMKYAGAAYGPIYKTFLRVR